MGNTSKRSHTLTVSSCGVLRMQTTRSCAFSMLGKFYHKYFIYIFFFSRDDVRRKTTTVNKKWISCDFFLNLYDKCVTWRERGEPENAKNRIVILYPVHTIPVMKSSSRADSARIMLECSIYFCQNAVRISHSARFLLEFCQNVVTG